MNKYLSLFISVIFFLSVSILFTTPKSYAATLFNASDTLSTSRPSASTPLSGDQAASASQVTVYDNGSIFLASDSATLWPDTGETLNTTTVASMSASNTPTAGKRIVYFNSTAANAHHDGDVITSAATAMHKVTFKTINAVPASGKIVIIFPGSGVNIASPSATAFSFNGLTTANAAANISYKLDGSATCTFTIAAPNITCAPSTAIAADTTITFLIGCADSSSNETSCTAGSPRFINPTKTAAAGTADTWALNIKTQDNNSIDVDTARIKIGTVDAVTVFASVDPTLTVTIAGLANGANFNASSGSCPSETTNSGYAASATEVNLGVVSSASINKAGQTITVSTNAAEGYTITATSSGRLIDASNGYWITDGNGGNGLTANDTPASAVMTAGTASFGIGPCGARVPAAWVGGTAIGAGAGGKVSNPWNTGANSYYATVASHTGGAVDSEVTVIRYAITVAGNSPSGLYQNKFTYVVTPSF